MYSLSFIIIPVTSAAVLYLSVSVAFREAPSHHVSHTEGFNSQQVEDHSVGQSELGLEDGGFTLDNTEGMIVHI